MHFKGIKIGVDAIKTKDFFDLANSQLYTKKEKKYTSNVDLVI